MSNNILDLQRLPESNVLNFLSLPGDATQQPCTVCSVTCPHTMADE